MKNFDKIKTLQLLLYVAIAGFSLFVIFRDKELYQMAAQDVHVRTLCIALWISLGASFIFMFLDFGSFTTLRRENKELDNAVFSDPLTGIANRYSCDAYISQYTHRKIPEKMACATIDLVSLPVTNETYGHEAGDEVIQHFSDIILDLSMNRCFVGRNGGNKFLAIFQDCDRDAMQQLMDTLGNRIRNHNQMQPEREIRCTIGTALNTEERLGELTGLIALSDKRAEEGG